MVYAACDSNRTTPLSRQISMSTEFLARSAAEIGTRGSVEDTAPLFRKADGVAVDNPSHACRTAMIGPALGGLMEPRSGGCQRRHQVDVERDPGGKPIEEPLLILTGHLDEPLHGITRSRTSTPQRQHRTARLTNHMMCR
jgi:hypothetical protein